ncbi:uncharacterized protein LOC108737635 isoform X2 [Agrilus planipennis]|uniref:Uncharacterized protein LOC108737635 isoform X2 n=1 Tax=Agrilus planipennis TaxID=224129 RepID=A0A1W4X195_AGRPL|nr:uncharacterized protein LOC108737635 isoform X2 [Agrilus planipennis]
MNLMFRKNFRDQKASGGKTGIMKTSSNRHASKRSNRDQGYTPIEDQYFRTHLFFNLPRSDRSIHNLNELEEPRCGPMTGASLQNISPPISEPDFPQPLIDRNTDALLKWPSTPTKTTPTRQVSFSSGKEETSRTLSQLDRDCFIIPVHSLDRFLPAGVPLPRSSPSSSLDRKNQSGLNVMEVPDPKLCILCHLMSPLEPVDPLLESPLTQPILRQRIAAGELLSDIAQAKTAVTGMLLANMERNADFPFISYYIVNTSQTNPARFYNDLRTSSLKKFDPRTTKYTSAHTLDLYTEVASICRPPINEPGTSLTRCQGKSTGYIVSVYKVFEGDDREIFERNWLYWTGARMIYRFVHYRARSQGCQTLLIF